MAKKIEKLFKSYRDQLLHLAKIYGVVEIKSYARSAKKLTITQLELLLIKHHIKLPINLSSDKAIARGRRSHPGISAHRTDRSSRPASRSSPRVPSR